MKANKRRYTQKLYEFTFKVPGRGALEGQLIDQYKSVIAPSLTHAMRALPRHATHVSFVRESRF